MNEKELLDKFKKDFNIVDFHTYYDSNGKPALTAKSEIGHLYNVDIVDGVLIPTFIGREIKESEVIDNDTSRN